MTGGEALDALLEPGSFGRPARVLPSCGSTNDEATAWARAGAPEGAVVIAGEQTAGRGRLGRRWFSPPGANLYLSLVLRPAMPPHRAPPLTLLAGVALAEVVEALGGRPALKWPNDVLLDGRKAGGILTEMATGGAGIEHVVIGIGVNLAEQEFPAELEGRATSLAAALPGGQRVERDPFAAALLGRLQGWYSRYVAEGTAPVVAAWQARAWRLGERIEVVTGDARLAGVAVALDAEGALLLRDEDGRPLRVVAGEIAW